MQPLTRAPEADQTKAVTAARPHHARRRDGIGKTLAQPPGDSTSYLRRELYHRYRDHRACVRLQSTL